MNTMTIVGISVGVLLLFFIIFIVITISINTINSSNIISTDTSQTSTLRLTNNTINKLWVFGCSGIYCTPLPGYSDTLFSIDSNTYIDINIPTEGLSSARFFAKYGCDDNGLNCEIGDSLPLYTGPQCPYPYGCDPSQGYGGVCGSTPCQPPINSLIEFTFGCYSATGCAVNPSTNTPLLPVTFLDGSNVDGVSVPYRLIVKGNGISSCNTGINMPLGINTSILPLNTCPSNINLSVNGITSVTNIYGQTYDITSVDLQYKNNDGQVIACLSPCEKLTAASPNGFAMSTSNTSINDPVGAYCCPSGVSPSQCRTGPASNNNYTQFIRSKVPNVYTYAYDDVNALMTCGSDVQYEIIFDPYS